MVYFNGSNAVNRMMSEDDDDDVSGSALDGNFGLTVANDGSLERVSSLNIQGMNPHRPGGRSAAEMHRALHAVMSTPGVQVQLLPCRCVLLS